MDPDLKVLWDLTTAFAVGLLIGIERGWKGRAKEEGSRIAGVRTFTLAGILGGITGQLALVAGHWLVGAAFISFAILLAVAHYVGSKGSTDVGITSQVALLITFLLGTWACFVNHIYVFGAAVVVLVLLGYKEEFHKVIRNISTEEIFAGIKLLVISVILLPILPDRGYGPFQALNPYWIWWMVVLITGLSFVGYVATSHFGDRIGILLTAVTGALASSTAVTLSLAQMGKQRQASALLMAGVLIASVIMLIRVVIEVAVVNHGLLAQLWIPVTAMTAVTLLGIGWLWLSGDDSSGEKKQPLALTNPFQLKMALKFGILLGVIILLAAALKEWFGARGIYVLSVVSGLLDVDAITISLSKMATRELGDITAARGIILAAITNTFVKGLMFAFITKDKDSAKLILMMTAAGGAGLLGIATL